MEYKFGPGSPAIDENFHVIRGHRSEFYRSPDGETIELTPDLTSLLADKFQAMPGIPSALVHEFGRDRRTAIASLYDPQTGEGEREGNLDLSQLMFVKFVPGSEDKILILSPNENLAMQKRLSLTSQAK